MPKFSDFAPKADVSAITLDGQFACQVCDSCVDEAKYFPEASLLLWNCENSHTSKIEEFKA